MRALVVHGHYYQPPRADPWLGVVAAEATAAPFHDWNERIERECYRAVVAARLPGAGGRIASIENALAWTSFDFGPTLLDWMEREAPDTYAQVVAADRTSRSRLGFGNAIAHPYHHVILPLSSRRDKTTEVRWGIADFQRRFGRAPEGLWLPETAVDDETLDVLAAEGIAFTVLAPHQVVRAPARGRPGRCRTRGGRTIAVFVYDGPRSHDVAFGAALKDGVAWARVLATEGPADTALVAVATDGETYGHHHRFGEMALARMLAEVRRGGAATLTNFAAVLAADPPTDAVTLVEPSSWSCVHGVERWRADCGCRAAPERGWHQRWRAPLRQAVDWLAGELHAIYEREAGALLADPWAARDAYGATGGPRGEGDPAFAAAHAARPLEEAALVRARELLEMERNALRLFTSCAWFFDDLGGLEPLQVLRYGARAIELAGAEAARLDTGFSSRLAAAISNDPAVGDARRIYRDLARPSLAPPARVAASYAAARRAVPGWPREHAYVYDVGGDGDRVHLTDRRTGRSWTYDAGVQRPAAMQLSVSVAEPGGKPVLLEVGDLLERERVAIAAALTASLAKRALRPEDRAALEAGAADLAAVYARALARAVRALGAGGGDGAVLDLVDLFAARGWALPFDVQSAFWRHWSALPPAGRNELTPLALRLGFAPPEA